MSTYAYPLLIEKYAKEILSTIEKNRVTIIKGPTGCGKSTYVPLLLSKTDNTVSGKIAIIEPRRIAVTALYNILAPHIPNLGYKMRFDKKLNENTKVTIFTDGSFLNDIRNLDYDYIILDEVHERSIRTDVILGILKSDYEGKLILMSASVDSIKLERYFGAKILEIPGSSNPVEVSYLEKPTADYIVESYLAIKNIIKANNSKRGDILVFLPGEEDINELAILCKRIPSIAIYKIHSSMDDKSQQRIYESSNLTKVILSTNICETSLTIPNVKYVIDTGLCKTKIFNGINYLGIQSINRDSAIQRMGRSNRLGPGICHCLYTEYELLPGYVPEILRSDLCTVILQLINLGKNILNFSFLDFPPIKNVVSGLEFLLLKGCIEINCCDKSSPDDILDDSSLVDYPALLRSIRFKITKYGRRLALHPFDTHLANFYEQCIEKGVGYYASLLLSLISQENSNFMNSESKSRPDIIYLIEMLTVYKNSGDKQKYCLKNGLPYKGMELACRMLKTLNKTSNGDDMDAGNLNADDLNLVEKIFSNCFDHNLCERAKDGSYIMKRNGLQVFIHPSSGFFKRNNKKIVVVDIFCSTKTYARIVGRYYEQ